MKNLLTRIIVNPFVIMVLCLISPAAIDHCYKNYYFTTVNGESIEDNYKPFNQPPPSPTMQEILKITEQPGWKSEKLKEVEKLVNELDWDTEKPNTLLGHK